MEGNQYTECTETFVSWGRGMNRTWDPAMNHYDQLAWKTKLFGKTEWKRVLGLKRKISRHTRASRWTPRPAYQEFGWLWSALGAFSFCCLQYHSLWRDRWTRTNFVATTWAGKVLSLHADRALSFERTILLLLIGIKILYAFFLYVLCQLVIRNKQCRQLQWTKCVMNMNGLVFSSTERLY